MSAPEQSSHGSSRKVRWGYLPAESNQSIRALTKSLNTKLIETRFREDLRSVDSATKSLFNWKEFTWKSAEKYVKSQKDTAKFVSDWVSEVQQILAEKNDPDIVRETLDRAQPSAECVPNGVRLTLSSHLPDLQGSEKLVSSIIVPPLRFIDSGDLVHTQAGAGERCGYARTADNLAQQGVSHLRSLLQSGEAAAALSRLLPKKEAKENSQAAVTVDDTVTEKEAAEGEDTASMIVTEQEVQPVDWDTVMNATERHFRGYAMNALKSFLAERETKRLFGQGTLYGLSLRSEHECEYNVENETDPVSEAEEIPLASMVDEKGKSIKYRIVSSDGFFYDLKEPEPATLEEILLTTPVNSTALPFI